MDLASLFPGVTDGLPTANPLGEMLGPPTGAPSIPTGAVGGVNMPLPATPSPIPTAPERPRIGAREILTQMAPMLLAAFTARGNPLGQAALYQGVVQGQQARAREALLKEQDQQKRKDAVSAFLSKAVEHAQAMDTPEDAAQYLAYAEHVAQQMDPTLPAGTLTRGVPLNTSAMDAKKAAQTQKDAAARVEQLRKLYGPNFDQVAGQASVTFNGKPIKVSDLLALAELNLSTDQGLVSSVIPPKPVPEPPKTFQRVEAIVHGRRTFVNFDPHTGTYTDTKGQPVDAQPLPPSASSSGGGAGTGSTGGDINAIADAIVNGSQPPTTTGMYRNTAALRAALARKGYNLSKAQEDWTATQRHLATLNGPQQLRLRQAVSFAADSLDVIDDLNRQWQAGRFPILNKARLTAAANGALGPEAQKIAVKLQAQIADLVSELGTVYKGGNSSTDESLKLAATNLSANWSMETLTSAVNLVRQNLRIRQNSIQNTGPVANPGNIYAPGEAPAAPAGPPKKIGRFEIVE